MAAHHPFARGAAGAAYDLWPADSAAPPSPSSTGQPSDGDAFKLSTSSSFQHERATLEFAMRDAAARFDETRRLAAELAALQQQLQQSKEAHEADKRHAEAAGIAPEQPQP